jgi:hypothetical protein
MLYGVEVTSREPQGHSQPAHISGSVLLIYMVSGSGFGMRSWLLTTIPADLFAHRHFGGILGFADGGGGLGGFIGPFLAH